MHGLKSIKKSVDVLMDLIHTNAELEEQEKPLREVNLNRVFLGNPGTGEQPWLCRGWDRGPSLMLSCAAGQAC
jgi:hypothetical protein